MVNRYIFGMKNTDKWKLTKDVLPTAGKIWMWDNKYECVVRGGYMFVVSQPKRYTHWMEMEVPKPPVGEGTTTPS